MRYSSLKCVLQSLFNLPIWTVFLSTDSKIEQFIVPANLDGSARIVKGILERVPPFIALDTNIEAKRHYREDPQEIKKPMKQFATIKHMTMFGRPLWQLYSDRSYKDLNEFALLKLQGGVPFNINSLDHIFTALTSRISLDPYLTNAESVKLARNAVNLHLRFVTAVERSQAGSRPPHHPNQ